MTNPATLARWADDRHVGVQAFVVRHDALMDVGSLKGWNPAVVRQSRFAKGLKRWHLRAPITISNSQ
jgi:hypothetical protein